MHRPESIARRFGGGEEEVFRQRQGKGALEAFKLLRAARRHNRVWHSDTFKVPAA
ncbi:MAG: hypothetical protein OEU26_03140 [Candidatus Tectomicrobia bacterium]|nr:hypothetical protein [Candidatus Tectomicrobia bacterium]